MIRPFRRDTSGGYVELEPSELKNSVSQLEAAWQADEIPAKQRVGVDRELMAYRAGVSIAGFDVLVDLLRPLVSINYECESAITLLEVGCSSGYYSEAFAIKGLHLDYAGCDFSPAFIEMAYRYYPSINFRVEDATALSYDDDSFDIVLSGCCLLHIPAYEDAIAEASRVARRYVIFHRTPIFHQRSTAYFTKLAYGVKTVEIHFNEQELVALFLKNGLRVIAIATLNSEWRKGDSYATKSYLCEKVDISRYNAS